MKSINVSILQDEITKTLGSMYAAITALEICKGQFQLNIPLPKKTLDFYPNHFPYSYFHVDFTEFSKSFPSYQTKVYEQCLVGLITAVENCCYEILERYYIINFDKLAEQDAQLTFKELSAYSKGSEIEIGACKILVERKLRNEKTTKMLEKTGTTCMNGTFTANKKKMDMIEKYALLRNCIIHNQSRVTKDLYDRFGTLFGGINKPVVVGHKDCVELSQTIMSLFAEFDKLYYKNIIKDCDAVAYVSEIFIQFGYDAAKNVKPILDKLGIHKCKGEVITSTIARVRRNVRNVQFLQIQPKIDYLISCIDTNGSP
jgi:hypothetical protein